jgi:hypothetical protein
MNVSVMSLSFVPFLADKEEAGSRLEIVDDACGDLLSTSGMITSASSSIPSLFDVLGNIPGNITPEPASIVSHGVRRLVAGDP